MCAEIMQNYWDGKLGIGEYFTNLYLIIYFVLPMLENSKYISSIIEAHLSNYGNQ